MVDKTDSRYSLTVPVTLDFPNLFEARPIGPKGKESGKPKYSANFLFPKGNVDFDAIKALAVKVAKERWPDRDIGGEYKAGTFKFPWESGDALRKKPKPGEATPGRKFADYCAGNIILKSRSLYAPSLSGIENGKIVEYSEEATRLKAKPKFYSGVQVLAQFNFQAYDGGGDNPDGVTAYLDLVLTTNKGPKLAGGQPSAAEAFKGYVGTLSGEDPTGDTDLDDEIPF